MLGANAYVEIAPPVTYKYKVAYKVVKGRAGERCGEGARSQH